MATILRSLCLLAALLLCGFAALGQQQRNDDCVTAIVICSDSSFMNETIGNTENDFLDFSKNDPGCLGVFDRPVGWYYFAFRKDMPPNSEIEIYLRPIDLDFPDYDFGIYGPFVGCDSLGKPRRCSWVGVEQCRICPETGLGYGAKDTSESFLDFLDPEKLLTADGFVAPMVVQPGDGFFMYIADHAKDVFPFSLRWGGSAAPFLNCLADPRCSKVRVDAGSDTTLCANNPYPMPTIVRGLNPGETVRWTAVPQEATAFLSDSTIANPILRVPPTFRGPITYTLRAGDDICEKDDDVIITIQSPSVVVSPDTSICPNSLATLEVKGTYTALTWSTGATTPQVSVPAGNYSVRVEGVDGCNSVYPITVGERPIPVPIITGPNSVCEGDSGILFVQPGFQKVEWNFGATTDSVFVSLPGSYQVFVTDTVGCTGIATKGVTQNPKPVTEISGDTIVCLGKTVVLEGTPGFSAYRWSTGDTTRQITVGTPGVFRLQVTDGVGCKGEAEQLVEIINLPRPLIQGNQPFCEGDSTQLGVNPGFVSVAWSTGQTTPSIFVKDSLLVSVYVVNDQGCAGADTVLVAPNPVPAIFRTGSSGFCPGDDVLLDAGPGYSSYSWRLKATNAPLAATQTLRVNAPGDLVLEVQDALGCTTISDIAINQYPTPPITIVGDRVFCEQTRSNVQVSENYPVYSWSNGDTTRTLSVFVPNTYSVTVEDANGCKNQEMVTLNNLPAPPIQITGNPAFCPGDSTILTGNTGVASYRWSSGGSGSSETIRQPGKVFLTVTGTNGCLATDSILLSQFVPVLPVISGVRDVCPGESTPLQTTQPFATYNWNNGAETTAVFVAPRPGVYTLQTTDANGCKGQTSATIGSLPVPTVTIVGRTGICPGKQTPLRLEGNFTTQQWSTGSVEPLLLVSQPGTYGVTVRNNAGCSAQDDFDVTLFSAPEPVLPPDTAACSGGRIALNPGNFKSYLWNIGAQTPEIVVDISGEYSVIVVNTFGCLGVASTKVSFDPVPQLSLTGPAGLCPAASDTLVASSNQTRFEWQDGSTDSLLVIRTGGTYTVTVTDAKNCSTTRQLTVSDFPAPQPGLPSNPRFCPTDSLVLQPFESYKAYRWSQSDTTASITISSPGLYQLTVTDSNNCTGSNQVQVDTFLRVPLTFDVVNPFCAGDTVPITIPNYRSIRWEDGSTAAQRFITGPGRYEVAVVDENNCPQAGFVQVDTVPLPRPVFSPVTNFCPGSSVNLQLDRLYPFTRWSTGDTTPVLQVSSRGTYSATIRDNNGCEASVSTFVDAFPTPTPGIVAPPFYCDPGRTRLEADSMYVQYRWSTGDTTSFTFITGAGVYQLSVTDDNGCLGQTSISLQSRPSPTVRITAPPAVCVGAANELGAPSGFVRYRWSNGDSSRVISVNQPGVYSVLVTDGNGCTALDSVTLSGIQPPLVDAGPDQNLTCLQTSVQLGGNSAQGATIEYEWAGPGITGLNQSQRQPRVIVPGEYALLVRDRSTGCVSAFDRVTVLSLIRDIDFDVRLADNLACNLASVAVEATVPDTLQNLQFQWFNPSRQAIPNATQTRQQVQQSGWYTFRLTDNQSGCVVVDSVEVITDLTPPLASAGLNRTINCTTREVVLDGTTSSQGERITYTWRALEGVLLGRLDSIVSRTEIPGQYELKVRNEGNGCLTLDTVLVDIDTIHPLSVAGPDVLLECLIPYVEIGTNQSSTGATITYTWLEENRPDVVLNRNPTYQATREGFYQLIVRNAQNGCADTSRVRVNGLPNRPERLFYGIAQPVCLGDAGQMRFDSVRGGTQPLILSLTDSAGAVLNFTAPLQPGRYVLKATDTRGCFVADTLVIVPGNSIQLDVGEDLSIPLGESVLLVPVTQSSSGEYTFTWTAPDDLPCFDCPSLDFKPLRSMTITGQSVDERGCISIDSLIIQLLPGEVFIPNAFSPYNGGKNERFTVYAGLGITAVESLMIHDRWGNKVFERKNFPPNDENLGWDGSVSNPRIRNREYELPDTFVYIAVVSFIDGTKKQFSGSVNLVR